ASTTREPLNKSRSNQARHSGFRRDDEQEAAWSEYPWQAAGLESAGLQIRLRGPYSRRFLAHRTTMRLRIVDCCPHAAGIASTAQVGQAPRSRRTEVRRVVTRRVAEVRGV